MRVYAPTRRSPEGAKAFFINYRSLGVERRLTIGEFPTWSALAARGEAKALRKRIDSGEDPARDKREARSAPRVKDLCERYRSEHLPRKAPSSRKADWAMIEREILPVLGERKVADIHFGDMAALHEAITARGNPVRANRVLSVASKMLPSPSSQWLVKTSLGGTQRKAIHAVASSATKRKGENGFFRRLSLPPFPTRSPNTTRRPPIACA